ncbi:MAG TPA: ABC transporter permease [Candidatus Polarisedimenticolia bacterium]|nr:ABC transporter permease [Candidatus Polarisedimenticolia bacterium]
MQPPFQDVRYAFRQLRKHPAFATVAVLTLALGIGANTAMFTVVHAVLLRPLAFHDPARLVLVAERNDFNTISVSYQNYLDWRDQSTSFAVPLQATQGAAATLTGTGDPERLVLRRMSAGLLPMLGVTPVIGRAFADSDDRAGAAPVVLLGYGLWQRRFGGSPDVVGTTLDLDAHPCTVVGVLPRGFEILQPADVFAPFHPWASTLPDDRNWHPGIITVGRLKEGVSRRQATTEMVAIAGRLEKQYPDFNTGISAEVVGLQDQMVQNVRPALFVLLGAVSFVLLIACANVTNLLLARAASRGREVAIRTALGAGRARLVRQLVTESVVLSLLGGLVGLFLAWLSLGALLRLAANALPAAFSVELDPAVLAFTFVVAAGTGLVFGVAPALRATKLDLRDVMNEGSHGSTGAPRARRLRGLLITAESALAMLLLVGAGLLLQSFARLQDVAPGFQADHLLVADLPLSQGAYPRPEQREEFFDRVLERASALPGVRSAGAASFLPVSGGGAALHFNITGRPVNGPNDYTAAGYRVVTPGYFQTLGVPLLKGRFFAATDDERAASVVIVNSTMARTYFPNQDPLGQRLQIGATPDDGVPKMEIVGVVGDVIQGLDVDAKAEMYLPYRQGDRLLPAFLMSVVMRTAGDPLSQTAALRRAVAEIDPTQPLVKPRSMEDNVATSVAQPRFRTFLIGIFAGLALLLAAVGIYGMLSYSVTQRTREIAIRVTLGAERNHILRTVAGEGLRFTLLGVALGIAGGLALTRLLQGFLFGVSAFDPGAFAGAAVLLTGVALAASLVPARRATRVDPLVALRSE